MTVLGIIGRIDLFVISSGLLHYSIKILMHIAFFSLLFKIFRCVYNVVFVYYLACVHALMCRIL